MASKRLLLVDLSHLFWSTWHATAGQDVDAAFRVTLQRVTSIRDGYDAVAICCDIGPSWRKKLFEGYKAGRPERDPAAYDQLRRLREQLEADGLPVLAVENYEADDIIATLAAKAAGHGYDTVIATGDKDLLQLVGGPVSVLSTNNGGGILGPEQVKEKFGVAPERLGDFLALVGDKSDNIQGAPGVGPVNAARLLNELGSLENMLAVPEGITPQKTREVIVANADKLRLARKLVSLSLDVPLDFAASIAPRERKTTAPIEDDAPDSDDAPAKESPLAASGPVMGNSSGPRVGAELKLAGNGGGDDVRPGEVSSAIVLDREDPSWMLALEPRGLRQLDWFAKRLFDSQLYRKFPNADAIMAVILRGRSMGLDMMTSLDVMNVIKGKPAMGAMAIIGRVLASGLCDYFDPIEAGPDFATWETLRKGRKKPIRNTYTIQEAEAAGLTRPSEKGEESNWIKRAKPMLWKQSGVELARLVYPDIVANVYTPEELMAS